MSGGRAHGHHRAEWVDYLRVWPLSIRPFSLEVVGDIERGWLIPVDPAEGAVSLFMPDFEVSFEEGLGLGLGSLLVPAAVPAPAPATPGVFCAKATPVIIVRHVAAIINFFMETSLVGLPWKGIATNDVPAPSATERRIWGPVNLHQVLYGFEVDFGGDYRNWNGIQEQQLLPEDVP